MSSFSLLKQVEAVTIAGKCASVVSKETHQGQDNTLFYKHDWLFAESAVITRHWNSECVEIESLVCCV